MTGDAYTTKIDRLIEANNTVAAKAGKGMTAASIARETGANETSVKKILAGDASRIPERDVDAILKRVESEPESDPAKRVANVTKDITTILKSLR